MGTHDVPGVKWGRKVEPHPLKGNGQIQVTVVKLSALQLAHLSLQGQDAIIIPRQILTRIHGALDNAKVECVFSNTCVLAVGQAVLKITERAELNISA